MLVIWFVNFLLTCCTFLVHFLYTCAKKSNKKKQNRKLKKRPINKVNTHI